MAENGMLTRKQKRAMAALLSERTIEDAARAAKVGERTLYRWLADSSFRAELTKAESDLIDDAVRRLASGAAAALDALANLIASAKSESVRKAAASDWVAHLLKLRELCNTEQRLAELERMAYGNNPKTN